MDISLPGDGGGAHPDTHFLKLVQLRRNTMADAVRSMRGRAGQAVAHSLGPTYDAEPAVQLLMLKSDAVPPSLL